MRTDACEESGEEEDMDSLSDSGPGSSESCRSGGTTPPKFEHPRGYRHARTMAHLRRMTKGLTKKIRDHEMPDPKPRLLADEISFLDNSKESKVEAWRWLHGWLMERGHVFPAENAIPLPQLWSNRGLPLPRNLARHVGRLPLQARPDPEDDWRYFPLNWAEPHSKDAHRDLNLHKSVPAWEEGWCFGWHGTSIYGLSSALFCGFLAPSEPGVPGNNTAGGRGTYTSRNFLGAAKHGIPLRVDESSRWLLKVVLLTAIPGNGGEGGAGWWEKKKKGYNIRDKDGVADSKGDWRLSKQSARKCSTWMEPDWTLFADREEEDTSSRAYLLGFCALVAEPHRIKSYKFEGKKWRMTHAFVPECELPPARPLQEGWEDRLQACKRHQRAKKAEKNKRQWEQKQARRRAALEEGGARATR